MRPLQTLSCFLVLALIPLTTQGCWSGQTERPDKNSSWIPLFNGEDLSGWTPKIRGYALGEDPRNTFRVEDGLLKVRYDGYEEFDEQFGHLFFESEFDHYNLLLEYRFVGEACPGGPGWAWRNSGVMVHSQSPDSMRVQQPFPVSIEVQTLGSLAGRERSTANLCTPGTHVHWQGELHTQHCTDSTSTPAMDADWVTLLVEVRGNRVIRHRHLGATVLEYTQPQLDEKDPDAARLIENGSPIALHSGYISLQSESHPVDFRRVEIELLEE